MKVVKISPKGQITIPKEYRQKIHFDQYMINMEGQSIVLKPVKIEIIGESGDELRNFGLLSEKSFDFWNNVEDDIYDSFYRNI
ncbi:AbrB/MazE/SpoVT family DNA-binding domain-containing protein [Candidatus Peregrinibacteria bacterium]|nr:AbrB/MazE/SpoVT family DNA-binding domain-containing protein [Candidatus Peregrinibacteria bacterium]